MLRFQARQTLHSKSSIAGKSHPHAPTEPHVNLSVRKALIVQPLLDGPVPSVQTDGATASVADKTIGLPELCGPETFGICAWPIW